MQAQRVFVRTVLWTSLVMTACGGAEVGGDGTVTEAKLRHLPKPKNMPIVHPNLKNAKRVLAKKIGRSVIKPNSAGAVYEFSFQDVHQPIIYNCGSLGGAAIATDGNLTWDVDTGPGVPTLWRELHNVEMRNAVVYNQACTSNTPCNLTPWARAIFDDGTTCNGSKPLRTCVDDPPWISPAQTFNNDVTYSQWYSKDGGWCEVELGWPNNPNPLCTTHQIWVAYEEDGASCTPVSWTGGSAWWEL